MSTPDATPKGLMASITKNLVQESNVHFNLGQDVIVTTEDKLRGALRDHLDGLHVRDRWHTPASLSVTLILVFVSASFHDALTFQKATWEAVFLICTAASVLWLAVSVTRAFRSKRSIDTLLAEIKRRSATVTEANAPSEEA
jgi:hypothetical protein